MELYYYKNRSKDSMKNFLSIYITKRLMIICREAEFFFRLHKEWSKTVHHVLKFVAQFVVPLLSVEVKVLAEFSSNLNKIMQSLPHRSFCSKLPLISMKYILPFSLYFCLRQKFVSILFYLFLLSLYRKGGW